MRICLRLALSENARLYPKNEAKKGWRCSSSARGLPRKLEALSLKK
jgi:hypothetical protein